MKYSIFIILFIFLSCELNKKQINDKKVSKNIFESKDIDSIIVYCNEFNYPELLESEGYYHLNYSTNYIIRKTPLIKIVNRDTINLICNLLNDYDTIYSEVKNFKFRTEFIIRINDTIFLYHNDDFRFYSKKFGMIEFKQPIVYNLLKLKNINSVICENDSFKINYRRLKDGQFKPKKYKFITSRPILHK